MVDDGDPPTKKRRTDSVPTLDAIAQSNATLQYLTGSRHNRWMHGFGQQAQNDIQPTSASSRSVHVSTNGASQSSASNTPAVSSPRVKDATASASNAPATPAVAHMRMQQARPVSRSAQRAQQPPSLVQYEVPMPTSTLAVSTSERKSMDATALHRPASRLGLPSPAPSDENNTDPPTSAESHLQQRRSRPSLGNARPHTESWLARTTRASTPASPVVMSPTQQFFAHQHHFQQAGYPQPPVPAVRGHTHANSQHLHRSSINRGQLPPDMARVVQPSRPFLAPPVGPSKIPQPQRLQASRVPVNELLQRLSTVENDPTHTLSQTETGRMILLREAVDKQDWFYQMTSQLFCMRSANPGGLPQSVLNLDSRCWVYLSILLCPNTDISPRLLQFFENFPEPIMHIYSDQSQAREIYEMRLHSIKTFLQKMPTQWESLVARCKDLQVPPLVQDLVGNLNVNSEVLQTTIFRAIMRMLYGPNKIPLMSAVEKLHLLDQAAWNKYLYKRTPHEKSDAYTKLHSVWKRWSAWKAQGGEATGFEVPRDVLEFFSRTPPNPFQSLAAQQAQNTNQHHQQLYHQQLVNRVAQSHAQGHAHTNRSISVSSQVISPLTQQQHQQYQARLMTGHSPIDAPGYHAPGLPYGRSKLLYHSSQEGYRAQPTQPDPIRSALLQAHLHSPVLTSAKIDSGALRLYRNVVGFSLPPTSLDRSSPLQRITFEITAPIAEQLAKVAAPSTNVVDEQSLMLRLRCSPLPAAGFESESAWIISDNYWPEEVSFECNSVKLETRRKLHSGRYLPADLTRLVTAGENTLQITTSCKKAARRNYAVAVEVIGFISHDSISKRLTFFTAEQSLATIKNSLSGQDGDDDDDDDLAVTSSTMTIKLFDPYSGCKIFDTPVRGATCLHKDCFDLETFLSMCKRPAPDAPTLVDCWRCPLCKGDVRPQTLLVDGFMVQVREKLAKGDLLDTRAIVVEADGSWKPKKEEATGVRSPSLDRTPSNSMPPPASTPKAAPKPPPIVIELD